MKPSNRIKLFGGLRDLPILDKDGRYCGVVDDIEIDEKASGPPTIACLLVGPGAYRGRLPAWAMQLVAIFAGMRITRVPWDAVARIDSCVTLIGTADSYGLHRSENRARSFIPKWGAM